MNSQDNAKGKLIVELQNPQQEDIDHRNSEQFRERGLSMNSLQKVRSALMTFCFAIFILMILTLHKSMAGNDDGRKRVLIIHSYHSGLSWSDNISNSIRKEFINEKQIDIFTEFLDTKHIALSQSEETYKIYFSIKYKKFRPDVIIVSDNDALDFVLRNRLQLFPDIPIVFCAINNFNTELLKGQKNITGVVEETAPLKTINLILTQNPNLQRLVIISDQTTTGVIECDHVEKELKKINKNIRIEWWKTLREKDLQPQLSKLTKEDAVLLILFNQDASGKYFSYEESAEMITKYSPVPVYGLWDFYLNHGIVGGCLTNSIFQGKSAAQLATKILNHEKADNIPIIRLSPNECILDAKVVKKFDLEDMKLSVPVVYINEQPNWVKDNIILICIVLSLLILEALIIVFLFWQKHKSNLKNIQILKVKAEESNRLKSAFLANMSHEIRTPMNGILGFSSLLKESNLTGEKQQEYIKVIEKSGNRMLNIINEIIDISKIEAGLMLVNKEEVNISEQIDSLHQFFTPEAEAKGLHFIIKNKLSVEEAVIKTDREKVYSILTNLIKNAIKFTSVGSIELGCERKGEQLEFFVKDTGIGIPKDRQEAIFERFTQADIEDQKVWQGAGLGLTISKAYVEMLGGKIWLESIEGKGTIFYFTLPYTAELKAENDTLNLVLDEDIEPEVRNLKILIAEDDETSEMLISQEVKRFSKKILKARTGLEAVEICHKNPDIDLILMDIRMPVMDGYMAVKEIRQFNKDVIIFAQTAYALAGDREKAIEAGCNDYISKPIIKDQLLTLIHKYIG
jgi:signal transduction histidine kinase/CheY-like chemotaxis protein/ABC-type uncharacterized transport system substrate-binding protein